MSMVAAIVSAVERAPLPDPVTRAGIAFLVARTARRLRREDADAEARFAADMAAWPIAVHAADANAQHYEVPAAFFAQVLGPRRKYSCCLYDGADSLAEAEERALAETALHAQLADGQRILELGCGWGSLTLWMARRYPRAQIVAVSNSHSQRLHIIAEAARLGVGNVQAVTADMNAFAPAERFERVAPTARFDRVAPEGRFDRIVSVEMFEHMANWPALLRRIHGWLAPDGRLFLHVFSHRAMPYRFDHTDKADWIATHFFTGGIMPSHGLLRHVAHPFEIEADWRWSGEHYRRTADDWLANFDRNTTTIETILTEVYGADAARWKRRWRLFFLATAGLFGANGGEEWGVSHYRLRPA
jgi:cyclopropane-fatty-acyl-phospholipid synthase